MLATKASFLDTYRIRLSPPQTVSTCQRLSFSNRARASANGLRVLYRPLSLNERSTASTLTGTNKANECRQAPIFAVSARQPEVERRFCHYTSILKQDQVGRSRGVLVHMMESMTKTNLSSDPSPSNTSWFEPRSLAEAFSITPFWWTGSNRFWRRTWSDKYACHAYKSSWTCDCPSIGL
ncbi:hypothetical protein M422DRAFT_37068 [Sphaerobolus stellatus SS14]|uniref:Uncharacterized protein n=1 Tax=Sphaerobolus stellatus (strain SS14) TaxID=990650 RepID=A0A0C9UV05_SPHS4|nr:hypothetical protein M422DRAFT_37068 [Sphaerobolus stellatus SS14]